MLVAKFLSAETSLAPQFLEHAVNKVPVIQILNKTLAAFEKYLNDPLPSGQTKLDFVNTHNVEFFANMQSPNFTIDQDLTALNVQDVMTHFNELAKRNSVYSNVPRTIVNNYDPQSLTRRNTENVCKELAIFFLSQICSQSKEQTLQYLGKRHLGSSYQYKSKSALKFDKIMPIKKTHEVEVMTKFVHELATICFSNGNNNNEFKSSNNGHSETDTVKQRSLVDVGSGKGYLSTMLNLMHGYNILAIDSNPGNSKASTIRASNIKKKWEALTRRAIERQENGFCMKRGKRWKSLHRNMNNESQQINGEALNKEKIGIDQSNLIFMTEEINENVDLQKALEENFPKRSLNEKYGIIGLHTCGNLAADTIKAFIREPNARFLCIVPCCYHLLKEFPFANDTSKQAFEDQQNNIPERFPLSGRLRNEKYSLGRNARMLSSYSLHRISNIWNFGTDDDEEEVDSTKENFPLPSVMLYRSLLEVLLDEKSVDNKLSIEVGRIRGKFKDFTDYVNKVVEKHELHYLGITKDDIERVYRKFEEHFQTFTCYVLNKVMHAPMIEAIILIDQLVYLLNQPDIDDAFVVELFDPATSPRCHAIVAIRRPDS